MNTPTPADLLEAFEQAWNETPPPDLAGFVVDTDANVQHEIVMIDLERRYRSKRGTLRDELGHQPRLEDYVRLFATLGLKLELTVECVCEEYRVRTVWGDQPAAAHYAQRFPNYASEVGTEFARVDAEFRSEQADFAKAEIEYDARAPLRYEDFEILELIGAGGVGKVYRCRQKSLDRLVALKSLHKRLQIEDWAIDAFLREGQVLAQLNHQGIARVLGMGRFPGGGYFQVMELIDGCSLRAWLRDAPADLNDRTRILRDIAETVTHAHEVGVIHCDLKPENILISKEKRVVTVDFGMAFLRDVRASSPTARGGTDRYCAPEAMRSEEITEAVDVFSLGMIGKELLGDASVELTQFLDRCQSDSPEHRPTIAELVEIIV